jgi:hypothetical protein
VTTGSGTTSYIYDADGSTDVIPPPNDNTSSGGYSGGRGYISLSCDPWSPPQVAPPQGQVTGRRQRRHPDNQLTGSPAPAAQPGR